MDNQQDFNNINNNGLNSASVNQNNPSPKSNFPLIILGLVLILLIGGVSYYLGKISVQPQKNIVTISPSITPLFTASPTTSLDKCADINLPKYEIAQTDYQYDAKGNRINGKSTEYLADLKGDGQKELVRVFDEQPGQFLQRQLPVTVKIFSGKSNCYKEELVYNGKESGSNDRSGNELNNAKLLTNFWDDGKDVVMAIFESTGYGSGWTAYMNFITFQNGKYIVVNGPTISDLSLYMFNGKNADGLEIIVANAVWASDEGHFDPHKYTFEKYSFNGKEYIKKMLGTTNNKYNAPIQEILQKEPDVIQ